MPFGMTIRHMRCAAIGQWAAISVMAIAVSGCQLSSDGPTKQDQPKEDTIKTAPKLPTPSVQDLAVDRRQLLLAVNEAASAVAIGTDDTGAQAALNGRQFILKLPIGCEGESDDALGWIYDEASQRLTIKATPDITLKAIEDLLPLVLESEPAPSTDTAESNTATQTADNKMTVAATRPPKIETADGFWIPRPWVLAESCPVSIIATDELEGADTGNNSDKAAGSEKSETSKSQANIKDGNETTATPTVGIAHFYTAREPRIGRRNGQPYRITKRVTEAERPAPQTLRLVIRGRLGPMPGGKIIQCAATDVNSRPRCVISASFDRISFENSDGSTVYAEWGGG